MNGKTNNELDLFKSISLKLSKAFTKYLHEYFKIN